MDGNVFIILRLVILIFCDSIKLYSVAHSKAHVDQVWILTRLHKNLFEKSKLEICQSGHYHRHLNRYVGYMIFQL